MSENFFQQSRKPSLLGRLLLWKYRREVRKRHGAKGEQIAREIGEWFERERAKAPVEDFTQKEQCK